MKKSAAPTDENLSFEEALAELDTLVNTLENQQLDLQQALQYFERGITLTRTCQNALKQAELKVEQVCGTLTESADEDTTA